MGNINYMLILLQFSGENLHFSWKMLIWLKLFFVILKDGKHMRVGARMVMRRLMGFSSQHGISLCNQV